MKKFILASESPRRIQLLRDLGADFSAEAPGCGEDFDLSLAPGACVTVLAERKARAVAEKHPEDIVVAADTMVFCGGELLGKPADDREAERMLRMLSGREHSVYTGVAVCRGDTCDTAYEKTDVRFAVLGDREISAYISTGEPLDKAGAYGIQGRGALLVEGISGDYYNVVGLPMRRLGLMLEKVGIDLFHQNTLLRGNSE